MAFCFLFDSDKGYLCLCPNFIPKNTKTLLSDEDRAKAKYWSLSDSIAYFFIALSIIKINSFKSIGIFFVAVVFILYRFYTVSFLSVLIIL